MRYATGLSFLAALFILSGCDFLASGSKAEVEALKEAKARWASFDFDSYTIRQTRSCECLPPYAYTAIVADGKVDSLTYDELENTYGKDPDRLYEIALDNAWTVEEAFEVLEREMGGAAEFEVEYDQQYGYPTDIFIDPDAQAVDEEIIRTMAGLQLKEEK